MSFSSNLDLPPEIWCQVFSLLSADDRLNVRLTCRHFYELCNEIQVQRHEESVFHGNLNTSSALQLLSSRPRNIRNFRFNHVHIGDTILPYFIEHGGNIHSLSFQNCKFEPGLFRSLLEQCTALHSFLLEVPIIYQNDSDPHEFRDIRALSANSITFEQAVDFKLHLRRVDSGDMNPLWTNLMFLQFLALFPRVKRLDLEFDVDESFDKLSRIPSDIASDNQFTASCIYDRILALRNQLEKLRLQFYTTECVYSYSPFSLVRQIAEIEMRNLKELSFNFIDTLKSSTPIPYRSFKHLTHIQCDFSDILRNVLPSIEIQLILSTIPGLVSLVYLFSDFSERKPLNKACFEALVKSRLTRLQLQYDVITDFERLSLKDTLQPNYLLKHLSIRSLSNDLILLFASHFRSLEHITFMAVDEITLHTIFKIQTNLRSLRLYNGRCGEWSRDNHKYINYTGYKQFLQNYNPSQNRILPHSRYLHINEDEIGLTEFLLTEFKFPSLKSLTICLQCRSIDFNQFLKILTRIPQVKFVKLHCIATVVPIETLFKIIQTLPNLSHIAIRDTSCMNNHLQRPVDFSEYRQLFNVRSSLRTVTHRYVKYFYDTTTCRVSRIPINLVDYSEFCSGIPHRYEYENKWFEDDNECLKYYEYVRP